MQMGGNRELINTLTVAQTVQNTCVKDQKTLTQAHCVENGALPPSVSMHILENLHRIKGRDVLLQLWILLQKKRELLFAASVVDKKCNSFQWYYTGLHTEPY